MDSNYLNINEGDKQEVSQTGGNEKIFSSKLSQSSQFSLNNQFSAFNHLQSKLLEFEARCFPKLEQPNEQLKARTKKKSRRLRAQAASFELKNTPEYLSYEKKTRSHHLSSTATFDTYKYSLGPGKYYIREGKSSQGGHFKEVPRFNKDLVQDAKCFLDNRALRIHSNDHIIKNKDMSRYKKEAMKSSMEKSAKARKIEQEVHRNTKRFLESAKKERRIALLRKSLQIKPSTE